MELKKHFNNSNELCEHISDYNDKYCFMMFSAGIDSIAMFYQLNKYFKRIVPIYMYVVPELEFVERYLNYFEHKFNKKILRIPHPATIRLLHNNMYNYQHNIDVDTFKYYDMDTMLVYVSESIDYPPNTMCAIGNKMVDNPKRFMSIKKYGSVNYQRSTFYPIYDWSETDVRTTLKDNKVKIPIDYKIFGRSFDGTMYRFMIPLQKHFPNDYAKIKRFFPLIDIEIMRAYL